MTYAQGYCLVVFLGVTVAFGVAAFAAWSKHQEDKEAMEKHQHAQLGTTPLTIGILPQDQIRARMPAIARREYTPKPSDPKAGFTSMTLARLV